MTTEGVHTSVRGETGKGTEAARTGLFVKSAICIFVVTAVAKLAMALGGVKVLEQPDPVLGFVSIRQVLVCAAIVETAVAIFVARAQVVFALGSVAWLATTFLVYRLLLWALDFHGYCSCLGKLSDILHLRPKTADFSAKSVMIYLLIGSYGLLARRCLFRSLGRFPAKDETLTVS
jgi:hypothetical protein